MTRGLEKTFGLPSMEDILKETEEDIAIEAPHQLPAKSDQRVPSAIDLMAMGELTQQKHAEQMDEIHSDLLKHGKDAAELAFDLDPARAPRMLEVAGNLYKAAIDALNSKSDRQMKAIELMQRERKLALEEQKLRHEMGEIESDKAEVLFVEDRNSLLKRMREEAELERAADKPKD